VEVDGHGDQVRVAEAQADLGGPLRARDRLVGLAAGPRQGRLGRRQVAVLDPLRLVAQQPLRAHQPAGRQCRLGAEEVLLSRPAHQAARWSSPAAM
jgi:hypothetical protein